jgi:glucose-6-phosphate 1-epimerase
VSERRFARETAAVEQVVGEGGLPKVVMRSADAASAQVHLHGGHVISWRPVPSFDERLFVSARAKFADGTPIRGGIPIIFPQFGAEGTLPRHGFARKVRWRLGAVETESDGDVVASFLLSDSDETRAIWPAAFLATLTIRVGGSRLGVALSIDNTGATPLSFTAALHTYLRVTDVSAVSIVGLHGCRFRENGEAGAAPRFDENETLRVTDAIDRVYFGAPPHVIVREPTRQVAIDTVAFPDVVVWNPGASGEPKFELAPGEYRQMVCVEAAVIGTPMTLGPGRRWSGSQTLVAQPRGKSDAPGEV